MLVLFPEFDEFHDRDILGKKSKKQNFLFSNSDLLLLFCSGVEKMMKNEADVIPSEDRKFKFTAEKEKLTEKRQPNGLLQGPMKIKCTFRMDEEIPKFRVCNLFFC